LKVVLPHPIECEKLLAAQAEESGVTCADAHFPLSEKAYHLVSYRAADWTIGNRGRRLDHIWSSRPLQTAISVFRILGDARAGTRPTTCR